MSAVESVVFQDSLFNFAYKMAFRDATMRKAFPRNEEEKKAEDFDNRDTSFSDRKNRIFKGARDEVKKYVDNLMSAEEKILEPIDVIKAVCNKTMVESFTFGNAQKLVNMTAKYMFLSCYGERNNDKKERFRLCHCPMDGIMIDKMKKLYPDLRWSFSWSSLKLDDDNLPWQYIQFQDCVNAIAVKNDILPLEVDFMLWDE